MPEPVSDKTGQSILSCQTRVCFKPKLSLFFRLPSWSRPIVCHPNMCCNCQSLHGWSRAAIRRENTRRKKYWKKLSNGHIISSTMDILVCTRKSPLLSHPEPPTDTSNNLYLALLTSSSSSQTLTLTPLVSKLSRTLNPFGCMSAHQGALLVSTRAV